MGRFVLPEGAAPAPDPAPDPALAPATDPDTVREQAIADGTRAEEALNRFLAARQEALFDAPDAFYRSEGAAAIHAAPLAFGRLHAVSAALLDGLANDAQRRRLRTALDAQMQLARDGIAHHVAAQSHAWQRQVAEERIALLTREAALHRDDPELVDALGQAAASAARVLARVEGTPADAGSGDENSAAARARNGVLDAAIRTGIL